MQMSLMDKVLDDTLKRLRKQHTQFSCLLFLFWNQQQVDNVEVAFPKQKIFEFFELSGGTMLNNNVCVGFSSPILLLGCRRAMKQDLSWSFSIGVDTARKLGIQSQTPIAETIIVFIGANSPEIEVCDFFSLD
jgi:hypothetical protein